MVLKRTGTATWNTKRKRWGIKVMKNGVRHPFFCSTPGKDGQRQANAKADAWLEDGVLNQNKRIGEILDAWLAYKQEMTTHSSYTKTAYFVNTYLRPALKGIKLCDVTEMQLQSIIDKAFVSKASDNGNRTAPSERLSKKTLTDLRATIGAFFKYCRMRKLTTLLPESLTVPKDARYKGGCIWQPSDLQTVFSVDTTILFGERVFDEHIYAFRFAVITGLRPGELLNLKWTDIHDNTVFVNGSLNRYYEQTNGKNSNAVRHFALSDLASEILEKQRSLTGVEDFVFSLGCILTYRERLERYCNANDITRITPYELRHTFVSVVKKLPVGQLRPIIGHSKSMDTYGVYSHEMTGEMEQTAKDVNALFCAVLQPKDNQ